MDVLLVIGHRDLQVRDDGRAALRAKRRLEGPHRTVRLHAVQPRAVATVSRASSADSPRWKMRSRTPMGGSFLDQDEEPKRRSSATAFSMFARHSNSSMVVLRCMTRVGMACD